MELYYMIMKRKVLENHKDRIEVKEALENGEGYSKRYSDTIKANLIYYATKLMIIL